MHGRLYPHRSAASLPKPTIISWLRPGKLDVSVAEWRDVGVAVIGEMASTGFTCLYGFLSVAHLLTRMRWGGTRFFHLYAS